VNLGEHGPAKIITRSDLKASMQSYEIVSLLSPLSFLLLVFYSLRSAGIKLKKLTHLFFSLHTRTYTTHTTAFHLALEFMFHLSIRAARNVPSHRRVRGRNGNLRRVRYHH
jgi:hypothetical protein